MRRIEILLAEDCPSDAELIMESLRARMRPDQIHVVHDGEQALDFLFCRGAYAGGQYEPLPRLILLDIKLPRVGGLDVLREVKSSPRTNWIPVVMLSSSRIEEEIARGYQLGANSYVQKPLRYEEFRAVVQQVVDYWLTMNETPFASVPVRGV